MHIEQFLSKFPCLSQQVHVLSSLLMNGTCLSTLVFVCVVFGIGGMWQIPYYDGPSRYRAKPSLYKPFVVNDSMESERQLQL